MRYLLPILFLPLLLMAESPKTLLRKGNREFKNGNPQEAVKSYDEALKQLPENPYLTYNKGVAALSEKNYEQAAQHFLDAQKFSLAAKRHDVSFESRCLASAGDAQYSQAKAMSETQEQNQQLLDSALKLCNEAMANYQEALKVNPANKDAASANEQARLLNKKLLGMKYLLPPPQSDQSNQSDQSDQKDKQQDQQQQQGQQDQQQGQEKQDQQQQQGQEKQDQQQQQQQQQQGQQDQQQQQQQGQEKQEQQEAKEEAAIEAKEIIDQEKQDKKERQKLLMRQMKIKPVEQDW